MKKLIIFDTGYGNTQMLAEVMGEAISAAKVTMEKLNGVDLLVVGSPTMGGRAKPELQEFLEEIPDEKLNGVRVAAFDTRFLEEKQTFLLKLLMKTIGYAAPKIAELLVSKGGKLVVPPEGFIVTGKSGPLGKGELERAKKWIKTVENKAK